MRFEVWDWDLFVIWKYEILRSCDIVKGWHSINSQLKWALDLFIDNICLYRKGVKVCQVNQSIAIKILSP